ncbi:MAG: hypothetical protein CEE38_19035 [Planctomycetes bacterium B3_Pla]|nr:MAG: hypothetical protein CEE38_19035 [Planctomycetes bacterium B3_Pla]
MEIAIALAGLIIAILIFARKGKWGTENRLLRNARMRTELLVELSRLRDLQAQVEIVLHPLVLEHMKELLGEDQVIADRVEDFHKQVEQTELAITLFEKLDDAELDPVQLQEIRTVFRESERFCRVILKATPESLRRENLFGH